MSAVSRSVYQKLKEENKSLLKDIYILTSPNFFFSEETNVLGDKWRKYFKEKKEINDMISEGVKQYIKEHPEFGIPAKLDSNPKAFK